MFAKVETASRLISHIAIRVVTSVVREADTNAFAGGVIETFAGWQVRVALQSTEPEDLINEDDLALIGPARRA
jgi:hypothetical protein